MKYGGTTRDTDFWIENASLAWDVANAPFHTVGMLTLLRNLQLSSEAGEEVDLDVTGNSTPDSRPVGSINRARCPAEVASGKERMHACGRVGTRILNWQPNRLGSLTPIDEPRLGRCRC
jgi:hypothetical protein